MEETRSSHTEDLHSDGPVFDEGHLQSLSGKIPHSHANTEALHRTGPKVQVLGELNLNLCKAQHLPIVGKLLKLPLDYCAKIALPYPSYVQWKLKIQF